MAQANQLSETMTQQLEDLNSNLIKYERKAISKVAETFVDDLKCEILKRKHTNVTNTSGGRVNNLMVAKYQVDTVIARRAF